MSEYIFKSHNATVLSYQLVSPAKGRRSIVFDDRVDKVLKEARLEIARTTR
ncbi:hypothetical protein [Paraburkholderia mimosarum]|uniref:hypothetical protein n=1 Tax=Paraburkholderia mimosarum TaxID=312026 RepID=UPI0012DE2EBA